MSNMMNDTMNAAKNGVESAKEGTMHAYGTAKHGVEVAKESTMQTVASAVSVIMKGVTAAAGILATLQKLDSNDGLAWFGLARRRGPFASIAAFGAGAAVGAGIALLLAPTSGAELRSTLLGRSKAEVKKIESEVEDAVVAVKGVVEDTKQAVVGAAHAATTPVHAATAPVHAAPPPHAVAPPHNGKPAVT